MGPVDASTRNLSALEPLPLALLPQDGLLFSQPVPVAWLGPLLEQVSVEGFEVQAIEAGQLELSLIPLGDVDDSPPVQLSGSVRAQLKTSCVRCQADLELPLQAEIELSFFAAGSLPEAGPSATPAKKKKKKKNKDDDWGPAELLSADAQGEAEYEGDVIDLPAAIEEFILLSFDANARCPDTEACDARTAALLAGVNAESEADEDFSVRARWAGLERFRAAAETSTERED